MGKANILVIPVWFTDSSNYILEDNKDNVREDIQTSYFGSNDETGWRSVKTYYEDYAKVKDIYITDGAERRVKNYE